MLSQDLTQALHVLSREMGVTLFMLLLAAFKLLLFRYSGPLGVAEKRFGFDPRSLLEADVRVPGHADWAVFQGPGLRNLTPEEMKSRFEHRRAVYKRGEEVTVLDAAGAADPVEVSGQGLRWVGLADTYFLSAQIPQGSLDKAVLQPLLA